jgi:hypothetical protein
MKLTVKDLEIAKAYKQCKPKLLGDLHQRMKVVMKRAQEIRLYKIDSHLWQALHDLQIEVAYTQPSRPPYGKRDMSREQRQRHGAVPIGWPDEKIKVI